MITSNAVCRAFSVTVKQLRKREQRSFILDKLKNLDGQLKCNGSAEIKRCLISSFCFILSISSPWKYWMWGLIVAQNNLAIRKRVEFFLFLLPHSSTTYLVMLSFVRIISGTYSCRASLPNCMITVLNLNDTVVKCPQNKNRKRQAISLGNPPRLLSLIKCLLGVCYTFWKCGSVLLFCPLLRKWKSKV